MRRTTNVNTALQRKIVHLDKKKQIKKAQFQRAKLCNRKQNQHVGTHSEHRPQNREFCTVYLCPSPNYLLF